MPTVTAHAPGRVNLIGEHTDYNGGTSLPIAIGLGTTVRVSTRDGRRLTVRSTLEGAQAWEGSLDDLAPGADAGWASYVAGVLWALADEGHDLPGLDIEVDSDLPAGGGLSSSAALECAVAVAVVALTGAETTPERLAAVCRRAETEYVGAPTGGLDQLASMLGAPDVGVLVDFAAPQAPVARQVPLRLTEAGLALLITDSGVRHSLADGDGGYAQRRRECEDAARLLGVDLLAEAAEGDLGRLDGLLLARARHVVTETARVAEAVVAVEGDDWPRFAALMDASHESLRTDFEVTVAATDLAVDAARTSGALGARMTGGGFGGSTVALMHEGRTDSVRDGIDAAFASAGLPRPTHHVVVPAAGARLISS